MVDIKVNTWGLNVALHRFIRGTQKDVALETQRHAKFLCLELASKASPRPRGLKGLAAAIPKKWSKRIKWSAGAIIKGARSLGLFHLARINDPTVFANSYYPTKVSAKQVTRSKGTRLFTGAILFRQEISPLHRIMAAAQKDPARALRNLRQVLKNRLAGEAPTVHQGFEGPARAAYYSSLTAAAKGGALKGKTGKFQKVFINTADPRVERQKQVDLAMAQIGTVKGGWIQAADAIPVKAGPRVPAWLRGKRSVGSGTVNQSTDRVSISLNNIVGNANGMADRTQYVNQALRSRKAKLERGLEEALKAQARKMLKRSGQTIPAHLAPGNLAEINSIDE
jgi:hypothetical protein